MKKIILLILVLSLALIGCQSKTEEPVNLSGYYEGFISVGTNKIHLETTLNQEDTLTGTFSIPGQGLFDLEVLSGHVEGNSVKFDIDLGGLVVNFEGTYAGDKIMGSYTQSGSSFNFELSKTEKVVFDNRERISVNNGDVKLSGELIVPEIASEMPVVLIVAGSGPTDMDGNSMAGISGNSYLYLAEALESKGIASLRYNKRILGNNISEADLKFEDFVDDAMFLANMLKEDSRFSSVYVIGHSQGALIAEILGKEMDLDGIVLLEGAGNPIDEVIMDQLENQTDAATLAVVENIFKEMKQGQIVKDIAPQLQALVRESVQPFLISWMAYDPIEVLKSVDEPLLAVFGSEDLQVGENEVNAFKNSETPVDYVVIEGMNHVLKKTSSDLNENMSTYTNPDLPIHESLIDTLIEFIK
ncbi:MAG: alpha/beta hydrolase [Clostridia bacterium]|nr:alpha/beta hydrolase [Clostridia bacterium]